MRTAEDLRRMYNERFSGPSSHWTSVDMSKCMSIVKKISRWISFSKPGTYASLDVGCALGYYTKAFYLQGYESFGLDYSEVAIEKAKSLHPECHFIHGDGFNPAPGRSFDLIFCRGFSGGNTHDLRFVAGWTNKYISLLNPGGYFIYSFSTDFSGAEAENETVNWSEKEISEYSSMIEARFCGKKFFYRLGFVSKIAFRMKEYLEKKKQKRYFYLIFHKM